MIAPRIVTAGGIDAAARVTLRIATVDDAQAIARIHVETWRTAYADILPPAFLAELSFEKRLRGWKRNLTHNGRPSVQVAVAEGNLVGWVSYGQCRDEGRAEAHQAEIYALYVDSGYERRGIGSRLLATAEAELAVVQPEATVISLWVLELNLRARKFYEARGYSSGTRSKVEPLGGRTYKELRYEKPVPSAVFRRV